LDDAGGYSRVKYSLDSWDCSAVGHLLLLYLLLLADDLRFLSSLDRYCFARKRLEQRIDLDMVHRRSHPGPSYLNIGLLDFGQDEREVPLH
jgi:hypothetical protein